MDGKNQNTPTAADVIAAAKVALIDADDQLVALCSPGDVPHTVRSALAKIEKWEAGR